MIYGSLGSRKGLVCFLSPIVCTEIASDQSDIEGRVKALESELRKRKTEAEKLRRQQKRMQREKLKAQEASLKKQLEVRRWIGLD